VPARPLTPGERVAARVVTGPLGHLWGGVFDWVEALGRLSYGWARGRLARR